MNIVIPMAGRGERFAKAGYVKPKPLIDVLGRPMYTWALESLPLQLASSITLICLTDQEDELRADLSQRYPLLNPTVIALSKVTEGQACTVLEARDLINANVPLIIFNADTYLETQLAERTKSTPSDGFITVFEAPGDHWSFARLDEGGQVLETAEKRRISPWATAGLYHFSAGSEFVRLADYMIKENHRERGEFYVAPVYSFGIAQGKKYHADFATVVRAIGTPAELEAFLADPPRANPGVRGST